MIKYAFSGAEEPGKHIPQGNHPSGYKAPPLNKI